MFKYIITGNENEIWFWKWDPRPILGSQSIDFCYIVGKFLNCRGRFLGVFLNSSGMNFHTLCSVDYVILWIYFSQLIRKLPFSKGVRRHLVTNDWTNYELRHLSSIEKKNPLNFAIVSPTVRIEPQTSSVVTERSTIWATRTALGCTASLSYNWYCDYFRIFKMSIFAFLVHTLEWLGC